MAARLLWMSRRRDARPGEELVVEGFRRLIDQSELLAYRYDGFWEPMDTIKDKQRLDALAESGCAPWQVQIPIPMTGELT